jgi:hypothetical protein
VKVAVQQRGADAFTANALVGAQGMGLDSAGAIDAVCAMARADFLQEHDWGTGGTLSGVGGDLLVASLVINCAII